MPDELTNTYSGGYGFIAIPDLDTIEKCYTLAKEKFPKDWEYVLGAYYLPHITLYHSKMKNVPEDFASVLNKKLNKALQGLTFNLSPLVCFGDKFIFWNIEPEGPSYDLLLKCHGEALELADYLDRSATKRADEEGLSLTEREKENVELYNHPLVRDLYMPHITLAYDEKVKGFLGEGEGEFHTMTIDRVEFAEIGHPGVVIKVIDFSNLET